MIEIVFKVVKRFVCSRSISLIAVVVVGEVVIVGVCLRRLFTRFVFVSNCFSSDFACSFVISSWNRSSRLVLDTQMAGNSSVHDFVVKVDVDNVYVPQFSFADKAERVIVVADSPIFEGRCVLDFSNLGCFILFCSNCCQIVSKVVWVALVLRTSWKSLSSLSVLVSLVSCMVLFSSKHFLTASSYLSFLVILMRCP